MHVDALQTAPGLLAPTVANAVHFEAAGYSVGQFLVVINFCVSVNLGTGCSDEKRTSLFL